MARDTLTLSLDSSPVVDAIGEMAAAHRALRGRHGEVFRTLERRIAGVLTDGCIPVVVDLGEGRYAAAAPPALSQLLRDARGLGVIS